MASGGDVEKCGGCRYKSAGGFEFFGGGERVACAVDEESGNAKAREVFCAELVGFTGRMQRKGEQQERRCGVWIFGGEHAGLPPAIRLAA